MPALKKKPQSEKSIAPSIDGLEFPRMIYKGHPKGADYVLSTAEEWPAYAADGWQLDVPETWWNPEPDA